MLKETLLLRDPAGSPGALQATQTTVQEGGLIGSNQVRRKELLISMTCMLHECEFPSYKTHALVTKLVKSLDIAASCTIFPRSILLSIDVDTVTLDVKPSWNLHRQWQMMRLVLEITRGKHTLSSAEATLEAVMKDQHYRYPWYVQMLCGYGGTSAAAAGIFYEGSWYDVVMATGLGILVYWVSVIPLRRFSELNSFITSFLVSLIASGVGVMWFPKACLYSQIMGGLVWVLPGVSIAVAVQELYGQQVVYGSAKLVYALFQAMQMGFGIAIGYALVSPYVPEGQASIPDSFKNGCKSIDTDVVDKLWGILMLPVFTFGVNVLLCVSNNRMMPHLGNLLGVVIGYVPQLFIHTQGVSFVPLICAFIVGTFARIWGGLRDEDYGACMLVGTVSLVPGAVSVRGLTMAASGTYDGGSDFTSAVLMTGVSIAMGLLISELPRKEHCRRKKVRVNRLGGSFDSPLRLSKVASRKFSGVVHGGVSHVHFAFNHEVPDDEDEDVVPILDSGEFAIATDKGEV